MTYKRTIYKQNIADAMNSPYTFDSLPFSLCETKKNRKMYEVAHGPQKLINIDLVRWMLTTATTATRRGQSG